MDKKEALAELRSAKAYLIKWKSQIMAFAWGMPVDPKHIPLVYSDGDYSQWFYADGQAFEPLPTHHLIAPAIEECFSRFQALYLAVNSEPEKAGFFGSQAKLDAQRKEDIEKVAHTVCNAITNLIDLTNTLEKEAIALSEEAYEKMI